jgi:hypothetical protein
MEACTFVSPQLHLFEFGNEFNFAAGKYRAANPPLLDYADEWTFQSAIVRAAVRKACPEPFPGLMAPSLVLLDFSSNTTWAAEYLYNLGYDKHNLTRELCFHKLVHPLSVLFCLTDFEINSHMGVNSPPLTPADFDLQRMVL